MLKFIIHNLLLYSQNRPKAIAFNWEIQVNTITLFLRIEDFSVPKIKVAHPFFVREFKLIPMNIQAVSVDKGINLLVYSRENRRENSFLKCWNMRFPFSATPYLWELTINSGYSQYCSCVTIRYLVPDSPYIFPGIISDAIKKSILQIIGFIYHPTISHLNLVSWFQPFVNANTRHVFIFPKIAPTHLVPFNHL